MAERLTTEDVVARCRAAVLDSRPALAVRDVLDELVADARALESAVGPAEQGGITALHQSDDLTVLRVAWTPGMVLPPHDHRMWAVIGMYRGQEDNAFFRQSADGLAPSGGRAITAGEVLVLGDNVIHSVTNSRQELAVALHVYGGDFFGVPRSDWDPTTQVERPFDMARTTRLFEEANARWGSAR